MQRILFNSIWFLCALAVSAAPAVGALAQGTGATGDFWNALARDDTQTVQTLLLRGIDTNVVHPEHGPAIVAAARERSWNTLSTLAQIPGTRVDAPNRLGDTALMIAALHGNLDIVRLLVDQGAEVNRSGWTPLHYAAVSGNITLVEYLLEQNAYIDAQSPNRTTPLMMAARHAHSDVVRLLVEAGADPTPRNDTRMDAAAYLQQHDQPELAAWMRERALEFRRRYGTIDKPRTAQSIEDEKRRAARPEPRRLPGSRD